MFFYLQINVFNIYGRNKTSKNGDKRYILCFKKVTYFTFVITPSNVDRF